MRVSRLIEAATIKPDVRVSAQRGHRRADDRDLRVLVCLRTRLALCYPVP